MTFQTLWIYEWNTPEEASTPHFVEVSMSSLPCFKLVRTPQSHSAAIVCCLLTNVDDHLGISHKFTKQHGTNFQDTTLAAASAAKMRAEKNMERQASAIEKQQQKIEREVMPVVLRDDVPMYNQRNPME